MAAPESMGSATRETVATVASMCVVTNHMTVPSTVATRKTDPGLLWPIRTVNGDIQHKNSKAPPHAATARAAMTPGTGSPKNKAASRPAVPAAHSPAERANVRLCA